MILDKIVEKVKERYEIIKKNKPLFMLLNEIAFKEEHEFIFYDLFKRKDFIFICECKKASPSKGIIKEDFNYLEIAKEYEEAGADVISCLTEPFFFLGSDAYLKDIKRNVSIPVLRKDFIIDPYQIYESKELGADVILLIVAILSDKQLKDYIELAHSLGMSCLVETHNESEIEKAVSAHFKVDAADLYKKGKYTYPYDGARSAMMWLLYSNGVKSYVLSELFGITDRQVQIICARACVALKSDTKFKEDIEKINQQLNS